MQAQNGLDTQTLDYLTRAMRHGNFAAWARHLDAAALERLRIPDERLRELLRVSGELRSAMAAGESVDSIGVQSLVFEWEALLDEFADGDAAIKDRMPNASA